MKIDKEKVFVAIMTYSNESMSWSDYEIMGTVRDPKSFFTQAWFIEKLPKNIESTATIRILETGTCGDLNWRETGKSYGYTDYSLTIEEQDLL